MASFSGEIGLSFPNPRGEDQFHASHQGVASTLRRSRELVFWPNMSGELKGHISMCDVCCALSPKQPKETIVCHDVPDRPWAKIATDLFELENKSYLVTIDYFSKFYEIDRVYDYGAASVIWKIKSQIRDPGRNF